MGERPNRFSTHSYNLKLRLHSTPGPSASGMFLFTTKYATTPNEHENAALRSDKIFAGKIFCKKKDWNFFCSQHAHITVSIVSFTSFSAVHAHVRV
jgi:hypothetical protein